MCVCVRECVYTEHMLSPLAILATNGPVSPPTSIDHFPAKVGGCMSILTHTHADEANESASTSGRVCVCAPVNNIQSGLLKIYLYMMFMMTTTTATQSMSAHTHTHTHT